ncbi:hypothetical protein DCC81_10775 [Chitinophaga parva]|uniref:Uncharacterized protein n=1 Tax=Chitinophaga parva TaxID=2169414 RepID=A0A2T7BEV8_9BACT|nr:hypothetical protein DCC81_10775 [Chitinophaga parva]
MEARLIIFIDEAYHHLCKDVLLIRVGSRQFLPQAFTASIVLSQVAIKAGCLQMASMVNVR